MTDQVLILRDRPTLVLSERARDRAVLRGGGDRLVLRIGGQPTSGGGGDVEAAFGFENFGAGQTLSVDVALAGSLPATPAASVAYTKTPPSAPQTVTLLDGDTAFGTATWDTGQAFGVLVFDGPVAPFVRQSVPGFITPADLVPDFTHFAITYAGA